MNKPIGVVESAYIGEDKRGYAKIRFSSNGNSFNSNRKKKEKTEYCIAWEIKIQDQKITICAFLLCSLPSSAA